MTKLLVIETSARGEASISRNMARQFVANWRATHPGGAVTTRDLMETDLAFLTAPWLKAYFTPPVQLTPAMKQELALSDELVAELIDADEIAIGTPVHNYNVPAVLKAWIDHIVRKGITLGFDGQGLLKGKSATLLIASGGIYTENSPIKHMDIATQYLKLILKVIGIEDVTVVAGGGAKAVDLGETTMEDFLGKLDLQVRASAATAP